MKKSPFALYRGFEPAKRYASEIMMHSPHLKARVIRVLDGAYFAIAIYGPGTLKGLAIKRSSVDLLNTQPFLMQQENV